jgi:hypothetical protein
MYKENRPHFEELCSCVGVILTTSQGHFFDGAKPEGRLAITRAAYDGGADYFYDADCIQCGSTGVLPSLKAA